MRSVKTLWDGRRGRETTIRESISQGDPRGPRSYHGLQAIQEAFAELEREGVKRIELVNDVRKAFLGFGMPSAAEVST